MCVHVANCCRVWHDCRGYVLRYLYGDLGFDLMTESSLQYELTMLLNKHAKETSSNTPDFVLAEYLLGCLKAYTKAVQRTKQWQGGNDEQA